MTWKQKNQKGYGINASQFESVIGKTITKALQKWDFLTESDIEHE